MSIQITLTILALVAMSGAVTFAQGPTTMPSTQPSSALDFTVKDISGQPADLVQYKGKVVLIVNVASRCGYTPQYAGLEKLYQTYKDRGLVVIGFPANDFRGQEPGTDEQIREFCTTKYNVTFPMMSKISVTGDTKHALYRNLTEAPTAPQPGEVTWNFNKFLLGRDGKQIAHYDSKVKPHDQKLVNAIEAALGK